MTLATSDGRHLGRLWPVDPHMDLNTQIVRQWAVWMRAGGAAPGTIYLRRRHVTKVLRDLRRAPQAVSVQDLVMYFGAQEWKPATRRSYRASLRLFFGWLHDLGEIESNPAGLVPRVRVPRGLPRPAPEDALQEARHGATARVRLMIDLAAVCGLRRAEISRVKREHVFDDLEGKALRVIGKGGHERDVPLPAWLAVEILSRPPGWLFPSDRVPGPMRPERVGYLVSQALPGQWTCHTLRHRCASVGYGETRDIRAVQELLGHLSASTTAIYTKVPRGAIRAAVEAAAA